jgi:response regulator RpfG family c-di-GMP phosphodiesterase
MEGKIPMTDENEDQNRERPTRILLVVDSNLQILKMLRKLLGKYFDDVIALMTVDAASQVLVITPVTHVIGNKCALESKVNGDRFMAHWRRLRPSIERVVMYTGADTMSVQNFAEVDAVVGKAARLALLVEALRVEF